LHAGDYTRFRFEWRKRFAQGSPRFTLSKSRMRSRTGLASPVENQADGIAKYPRLRVHRHEARMTPAKRCSVLPGRQRGSRANWPRTQKAESELSGVRRPGESSFRPPFERVSDPQIPLTRQFSNVALGLHDVKRPWKNGPRRCRPSGEEIVGIGFVSFQVVSSSSGEERLAWVPRAPCRLQAIHTQPRTRASAEPTGHHRKDHRRRKGSLPETRKRLAILVLLCRSFLLLAPPK
jgi:hypothetical protein